MQDSGLGRQARSQGCSCWCTCVSGCDSRLKHAGRWLGAAGAAVGAQLLLLLGQVVGRSSGHRCLPSWCGKLWYHVFVRDVVARRPAAARGWCLYDDICARRVCRAWAVCASLHASRCAVVQGWMVHCCSLLASWRPRRCDASSLHGLCLMACRRISAAAAICAAAWEVFIRGHLLCTKAGMGKGQGQGHIASWALHAA